MDARELEFRILGPLEVWSGRDAVEVRGPRQRGLLAVLLLSANQVVSSDRLIEELWAEASSETARHNLQVNVQRLRKALTLDGGSGERVIVTAPPGYMLRVGAEQLDLMRFERLLERGSELLTASGPGEAVAVLREALGLWQGPPLAEFAYERFAQLPIGRLAELRLRTLEKRIEAELALGQHAELIHELEGLVREQPLQERLRGQFMLALYRSGRQAAALDSYQEARRILAEDVGIDPGAALKQLE